DAPIAGGEEHQSEPAALRQALSETRIELADAGVHADRGASVALPPGFLQSNRIIQRVVNIWFADDFESGFPYPREARHPISEVLSEFWREPGKIIAGRSSKRHVRGRPTPPDSR